MLDQCCTISAETQLRKWQKHSDVALQQLVKDITNGIGANIPNEKIAELLRQSIQEAITKQLVKLIDVLHVMTGVSTLQSFSIDKKIE